MLKMRPLLNEAPEDDLKTIAGANLGKTVSLLQKLSSDKDFVAALNKGAEDGDIKDEQVPLKRVTVACTKMYPTQAEIGFGNSLDDLCGDKFGAIDRAFKSPVSMGSKDGDIPILCASFGGKIAILDGHHRWSLCLMINRDAKMVCDVLEMPAGKKPEDALKIMQMAIAAKAGRVQTKDFYGQDLMATGTNEVIQYVKDNIVDTAVEKYNKYTNGQVAEKDAIADYVGESHKTIVSMKGKFPRNIMPQAGKSGANQDDVNKALAAGEINFDEPYVEESLKKHFQKVARIK